VLVVSTADAGVVAAPAEDPIESVLARLDEPSIVDSLHQLIDHLDLLAVLIVGLDGLVSRGDTIADSLSDGFNELRRADKPPVDVAKLLSLGQQLTDAAPALLDLLPVVERIAASDLGDPSLIDLAATVSRAAVRGASEAQSGRTSVNGIRSLLRSLKDEDVSRALGFIFSIAKALGQELKAADPSPTSAG
jgi:Protein of unknown function (DUF1641)